MLDKNYLKETTELKDVETLISDSKNELSKLFGKVIAEGETLIREGELDAGQYTFQLLLEELNSMTGVLLNNIAVTHIYKGDTDKAEAILKKLITDGYGGAEAEKNYHIMQGLITHRDSAGGNKRDGARNGVNDQTTGKVNILILGDSRVLPREWENKNSYFEEKLKSALRAGVPGIDFHIRTIAYPNNMMRYLKFAFQDIMESAPDLIIMNLNLCEFIPRSLPKVLYDWLDAYAEQNPEFVKQVRALLAGNRRALHEIFGKNSWNSRTNYIRDLKTGLGFLRGITKRIIFIGCLSTSEDSEYIRPGFQKDIDMFNRISEQIVIENGLHYLDLNQILKDYEYHHVSHDGIHYTDYGDNVIVQYLVSHRLGELIKEIVDEKVSVHMPQKPAYIQIELTNHCSVKCSMCELGNSKRNKGYMTKETYLRIIEQMTAWGIPMVRFTLWGEALMHPEFLEFVKIAKANDLKVGFNTNGMLLNETRMRDIMEAGTDQIIFSVDSFDDDHIYKQYRPGKRSIHDINRTILDLIRMKKEMNAEHPEIRIQMIGSELNAGQCDKFLAFWTPRVDNCRITHMYAMTRTPDINKNVIKEYDYFYECKYPWTTMGIYHNGDVTACCRDVDGKLKIGNVMDASLEDIYYQSDRLRSMRINLIRKNKSGMPEFCKSCFKYCLIIE